MVVRLAMPTDQGSLRRSLTAMRLSRTNLYLKPR